MIADTLSFYLTLVERTVEAERVKPPPGIFCVRVTEKIVGPV
jgi:hypothetical protein